MSIHRAFAPAALFAILTACSSSSTSDDASATPDSTQALSVLPAAGGIEPYKELLLVHPSVVADPVRTSNAGDGSWSFRAIMEQLSGHAGRAETADFVTNWLLTFHPENVPGVPAGQLSDRPGVDDLLARWPHTADGRIDLAQSPFKLLAIANRADLGASAGDTGQGRFVFGLVDPTSEIRLPMTVIVEFALPGFTDPARNARRRQIWSERFHALAGLDFGDPAFGTKLETITGEFVSAASFLQLRTNEITFATPKLLHGGHFTSDGTIVGGLTSDGTLFVEPAVPSSDGSDGSDGGTPKLPVHTWELREWHLGADGQLEVAHVRNTPHKTTNGSAQLAQVLDDSASQLLAGTMDFSQSTAGAALLGFVAPERFTETRWDFSATSPGVSAEVRDRFATVTCNGCHNSEQPSLPNLLNNVGFYHMDPMVLPKGNTDDLAGTERLSAFLIGTEVPRRALFLRDQLRDATNLTHATGVGQ